MTQQAPDHLPFARCEIFGLPFHGIVAGGDPSTQNPMAGTLTLPSAATMQYPQPKDGGCVLVRHPRSATAIRNEIETAYDQAKDYQWRDYELLSGRLHQIGGNNLGNDYHIYCDENYSWLIRTEIESDIGSYTVNVYLAGLFGLFKDNEPTMSERLLATWTRSPVDSNGDAITGYYVGNRSLSTYSETGGKVIANIGMTDHPTGLHLFLDTQHQADQFYPHDVIRITISGNGSIVQGVVGNGISGSINQVADATEFYSVNATDSDVFGTDPPSRTITISREEHHSWLYVTDANGSESSAKVDITESTLVVSTAYDEGEEGVTFTAYDYDSEQNHSYSFGGVTRTGYQTYDGTWVAGGGGVNSGTVDTNGTVWEFYLESAEPFGPGDLPYYVTPILPLVVYIEPENLQGTLVFANGNTKNETERMVDGRNVTYNPATDEIADDYDDLICFV